MMLLSGPDLLSERSSSFVLSSWVGSDRWKTISLQSRRNCWNGAEEEEGGGGGEGGLRLLTQASLRVVAVLGRKNLNNTRIVAFHRILSLSLPSVLGVEECGSRGGSETDPASNQEWGVKPSHHCHGGNIRATASLLTPTSLIYCIFCGFCLTGGLQVGFITLLTPAPPLWIVPPRGVYGQAHRMFGPPGDQSPFK